MSDTLYFNYRTWTAAELAALAEPLHIRDDLDLRGYTHPLPAGLTSFGGYLYLRDYAHPLPAALTSVGGDIYLRGYTHPLPATLTSVGGNLYLRGYTHPLPAGLAHRDTRTVAR